MLENNKKIVNWILIIFALLIGATIMYVVMWFLPIGTTNIIKGQKEVTVVDNGISEAVSKLYDAVVVVESYKKNKSISSGSGFVYKTDKEKAYILTNSHVISSGDKVIVTFTNNIRKEVEVIGSEVYSDIAVLSLDKKDILSTAEIGKNDLMKLGDTVFTIGAPVGSMYSGTVTRGILSGKDRMVEVSVSNTNSSDYVMKVMQTDAAINSGNSGGPLANSNGEVIGITSLKLASLNIEGMGFAIPIEDALKYASKLEKGNDIVRPLVGIAMIELNDLYNLSKYDIYVPEDIVGVVVAEVTKKSPADISGLLRGDIITKVENAPITSVAEFRYELYKHDPNDTITITLWRDDNIKNVKVKLIASSN